MRVSSRMRRSSSRAIRTRAVCSARVEAPGDALLPAAAWISARGRNLEVGPAVVQVPAQVVDQRACAARRGARDDRPATGHRARGPASCATGSVSRPSRDRGPGDRDGVDRDRTCRARVPSGARRPSASGATRTTRSPRREQEALQRPGDVAAVLDRPHPLAVRGRAPTPAGHQTSAAWPCTVAVGEHAAGRGVDRGQRVRVLVGVRPDHDHLHRPFDWDTDERIAGGHISVGAMPRSLSVQGPDRQALSVRDRRIELLGGRWRVCAVGGAGRVRAGAQPYLGPRPVPAAGRRHDG